MEEPRKCEKNTRESNVFEQQKESRTAEGRKGNPPMGMWEDEWREAVLRYNRRHWRFKREATGANLVESSREAESCRTLFGESDIQ